MPRKVRYLNEEQLVFFYIGTLVQEWSGVSIPDDFPSVWTERIVKQYDVIARRHDDDDDDDLVL